MPRTTDQINQKQAFQAQVSRLLDIVTHALYSKQELFLRELLANAADATDKLRFLAATENIALPAQGLRIKVTLNTQEKHLTISDQGIGMSAEDLEKNLGTIAHSGTLDFIQKHQEAQSSLIGQFGMGFYAAFMVASWVEVQSRPAKSSQAYNWTSDGKEGFSIQTCAKESMGTDVILHLKPESENFLDLATLRQLIPTYGAHLPYPIDLFYIDDQGQEQTENLCSGTSLWHRPKSELKPEDYHAFYQSLGHWQDPAAYIHGKQEGILDYNYLLFIPQTRPLDLFHDGRKHHLNLYIKKVFITNDCQDLLPAYLRFMQGLVDCADLPLNVSREVLQKSPLIDKIQKSLTKKVLQELKALKEHKPEDYRKFFEAFGPVLKEGLYEDSENRPAILDLCLWNSNQRQGFDLKSYVEQFKTNQQHIYYLTGPDLEQLKTSPLLESCEDLGLEVLFLTDPVDDFWIHLAPSYQDKSFKSLSQGESDLKNLSEKPQDLNQQDPFIFALSEHFASQIAQARYTDRLKQTPLCFIAQDQGQDKNLRRILAAHGQNLPPSLPILEVNAQHPLIQKIQKLYEKSPIQAWELMSLALNQSLLMDGEKLTDPKDHAQKIFALLLANPS